MPDKPYVSVVTPCLNQAGLIRRTIESVAENDAGGVEHIVVDGGSTDGTLNVLAEYPHLVVIKGQDAGPYDALNTGFERARGDVFAWLNADDFYLPHTLDVVSDIFRTFDDVHWLTSLTPLSAAPEGHVIGAGHISCYSKARALRPDARQISGGVPSLMQQESTFWRRDLWAAAGGRLDTRYAFAADFELWLRFWQFREIVATPAPLGCFRFHPLQRSRQHAREYAAEVEAILQQYGGRHATRLATICRRATLVFRGLPQSVLRFCPFATPQTIVTYDRDGGAWKLGRRHAVPA